MSGALVEREMDVGGRPGHRLTFEVPGIQVLDQHVGGPTVRFNWLVLASLLLGLMSSCR